MAQTTIETNYHHHCMNDILKRVIDRIDDRYKNRNNFCGLSTGFTDFDEITGGLQGGQLIVVGGRPDMGKSNFLLNIADHVAINHGQSIAVFSMNETADTSIMRMLSSLGRINQTRIRSGQLDEEDWPRLTSAVSILSNTKIFFDDTPTLSLFEIRERIMELNRENDIGLIVVDNLQLIKSYNSSENKGSKRTKITKELKNLAEEFNIPVIVSSNLKRKIDKRSNKRPLLSYLQFGSIGNYADIIVFLYRDEVYDIDSPDKGTAEIIINKHRYGSLGVVRLNFSGQYNKFENYLCEAY